MAISFKSLGWLQLAWLALKEARNQTEVFILATNDHSDTLTMANFWPPIKRSRMSNRAFVFSKPGFLTSSLLYLKKPERIEALLMVMTCSLMICSVGAPDRQGIGGQNRSVADMKKPTQQPTARWIFLRFGGIHEYRLGEAPPQVAAELTGDQQIILEVLGERYRQIYS